MALIREPDCGTPVRAAPIGVSLTIDGQPVTVPKGRLWVMGDHRGYSKDSRYHCARMPCSSSSADAVSSTVPISAVIGKAFVIAWPPKRWRTLGTPRTFTTAAAAVGSGAPAGIAAIAVAPLLWHRRRRPRRR